MRQIIHLQIGQAGNNIGSQFWQRILEEHSLDYTGQYTGNSQYELQKIDTCFNQNSLGKYVPRTIFVDLDPEAMNDIKCGPMKEMFKPQFFVSGQSSASNNWAKGYYGSQSQFIDKLMNKIRKEAEVCEKLQGFQLAHSIGGGTGSGLSCLLIQRIREEFTDRMIQTFTIYPSEKVSNIVIEPYNSVLSTHFLIEDVNSCIVIDNQALYNTCNRILRIQNPTSHDLNHLISNTMSNVTCSSRFHGYINSDLRKLVVNLVPFPRLHFFLIGQAPIYARNKKVYHNYTLHELTQQMFDHRNMRCAVEPRYGRFLSSFVVFRGQVAARELDYYTILSGKISSYFVQWIPNNLKFEIYNIPISPLKTSATLIANSTAMQQFFKKENQRFDAMFSRKAFLHWYTQEGMEKDQFWQAFHNIHELNTDYAMYRDASAQEYGDEQSWG